MRSSTTLYADQLAAFVEAQSHQDGLLSLSLSDGDDDGDVDLVSPRRQEDRILLYVFLLSRRFLLASPFCAGSHVGPEDRTGSRFQKAPPFRRGVTEMEKSHPYPSHPYPYPSHDATCM